MNDFSNFDWIAFYRKNGFSYEKIHHHSGDIAKLTHISTGVTFTSLNVTFPDHVNIIYRSYINNPPRDYINNIRLADSLLTSGSAEIDEDGDILFRLSISTKVGLEVLSSRLQKFIQNIDSITSTNGVMPTNWW